MIFAIVVAVVAVALGLGLGLAPLASRRALGPLRTLALAAVIGVAVLHLLPEAVSILGPTGLVVFALGLALPRWLGRLRGAPGRHELGLELGYWGLLVHHLGDGLALGAYSSVDERTGHSHVDVLLALVLHTVPLVAVVSAGYAKARGPHTAAVRAFGLMVASVLGILLARLVPLELVERAQAWIAAAVAGLLLHGMSHDMSEDLPQSAWGRAIDLLAAVVGGTIGWIGTTLDQHNHAGSAGSLGHHLIRAALASALPLLVGLLLGAALRAVPRRARESRFYQATEPAEGAVLGPEGFLLSLSHFGWVFSAVSFALAWLTVLLWGERPARRAAPADDPAPSLRFVERFDHVTAWAFAGIAASGVLMAAIPDGAFADFDELLFLGFGLFLSAGMPLHAVLAPIALSALVHQGLWIAAALVACVVGPFFLRPRKAPQVFLLPVIAVAVAVLFSGQLSARPLRIAGSLSESALVLLIGFLLARVYHLGLRGWLAPLGAGCRPGSCQRADSTEREGEGKRGDHAFPRSQ